MQEKRSRCRRPISAEGKAIKSMLAVIGMTQAEFCREYDIPQNRLSDIIHTDVTSRRMISYRLKIYKILHKLLEEEEMMCYTSSTASGPPSPQGEGYNGGVPICGAPREEILRCAQNDRVGAQNDSGGARNDKEEVAG